MREHATFSRGCRLVHLNWSLSVWLPARFEVERPAYGGPSHTSIPATTYRFLHALVRVAAHNSP